MHCNRRHAIHYILWAYHMRTAHFKMDILATCMVWGIIAILSGRINTAYAAAPAPVAPPKDVRRLVIEEQKIEGKIRRPQLVLIKADQRPDFEPMMMQSFGKKADIVKSVTQSVIEASPYDGAFQFQDKKISNYVP
jgi:hypothetical protein